MKPEEMFEAYLEDLNHGEELRKEVTNKENYFKLVMQEIVDFEPVQVRKMTFPSEHVSTAVSYMKSWEHECLADKTRDYHIILDYVNTDHEYINIGTFKIKKGVRV